LLAWEFCRKRLSLQVLCSRAGFHIGTADEAGPCSRESLKYFPTVELAEEALARGTWTQRQEP
jgi:hypothetical protein